jgi:hypothetical protein
VRHRSDYRLVPLRLPFVGSPGGYRLGWIEHCVGIASRSRGAKWKAFPLMRDYVRDPLGRFASTPNGGSPRTLKGSTHRTGTSVNNGVSRSKRITGNQRGSGLRKPASDMNSVTERANRQVNSAAEKAEGRATMNKASQASKPRKAPKPKKAIPARNVAYQRGDGPPRVNQDATTSNRKVQNMRSAVKQNGTQTRSASPKATRLTASGTIAKGTEKKYGSPISTAASKKAQGRSALQSKQQQEAGFNFSDGEPRGSKFKRNATGQGINVTRKGNTASGRPELQLKHVKPGRTQAAAKQALTKPPTLRDLMNEGNARYANPSTRYSW